MEQCFFYRTQNIFLGKRATRIVERVRCDVDYCHHQGVAQIQKFISYVQLKWVKIHRFNEICLEYFRYRNDYFTKVSNYTLFSVSFFR